MALKTTIYLPCKLWRNYPPLSAQRKCRLYKTSSVVTRARRHTSSALLTLVLAFMQDKWGIGAEARRSDGRKCLYMHNPLVKCDIFNATPVPCTRSSDEGNEKFKFSSRKSTKSRKIVSWLGAGASPVKILLLYLKKYNCFNVAV